MMRPLLASVCAAGVVLGAVSALAAPSARTPEETVRRYLQAVKDGKPEDAYDLVSRAMRRGKDRDAWVKEQREGLAWADVKIFSFDVGTGKVEGDKARVPNVLSSQDKFVNQLGLTEYELYTLVREDGTWRVDSQVIVEPPDIPQWFPQARKSADGAPAPGAGASPPPTPPAPVPAARSASPGPSPGASH